MHDITCYIQLNVSTGIKDQYMQLVPPPMRNSTGLREQVLELVQPLPHGICLQSKHSSNRKSYLFCNLSRMDKYTDEREQNDKKKQAMSMKRLEEKEEVRRVEEVVKEEGLMKEKEE